MQRPAAQAGLLIVGIDWLLLDRDRGVGQLGLSIQIDQYLVEYRGCAERTRVVENRHDGPVLPLLSRLKPAIARTVFRVPVLMCASPSSGCA